MTTYIFANNVDTTLGAAALSTDTSLTLASSTNLPTLAAGQIMPLTLNDAATEQIYEIVYVTAITGPVLTVIRAQEGTGAQNWALGDYAFSTQTARTTAPVNGLSTARFSVSDAIAASDATSAKQVQSNALNYAADTGTVNALSVTLATVPTALTPGMKVHIKSIQFTNTGASTLAVNGIGSPLPITSIQIGEFVAGGSAIVSLNSAGTAWDIVWSSSTLNKYGSLGSVGSSRNLVMSVSTAGATATMTWDELIVASAYGGAEYCIGQKSLAINLATTGAGGMDTGTAPLSGAVAIYAIYNPVSGTTALLASTEGASAPTQIYSGANMPTGYVASALVSAWMTDASGQFITGEQRDRRIARGRITAVSTTTANTTFTSASIASNVPKAAKTVRGDIQNTNSSTTNSCTCAIASNNLGIDAIYFTALFNAQGGFDVILSSPQVIYYLDITTSGTNNLTIYISGYTF